MPKVYIVILNWKGWRDTIECLESVLRLDYENFVVIVCDNNSGDGSLEKIQSWANGHLLATCSNRELRSFSFPPIPKPLPARVVNPGEHLTFSGCSERLFLIQTGSNLGFAAGNNVGLRMALESGDLEFAWLLNNDTVVHPNALRSLVSRMEHRPDAGICGATLLHYTQPEVVQALAGSAYNQWTARVSHVGAGLDRSRTPSLDWVESRLSYVSGASMFLRRAFLEQVGLMCEDYILYFEEIDWVSRSGKRFSLCYSPESFVYHKEGASIGTSGSSMTRSSRSEFYASRGRLLFTRRYYPAAFTSVLCSLLLSIAQRCFLGNWKGAAACLHGTIRGILDFRHTVAGAHASVDKSWP